MIRLFERILIHLVVAFLRITLMIGGLSYGLYDVIAEDWVEFFGFVGFFLVVYVELKTLCRQIKIEAEVYRILTEEE